LIAGEEFGDPVANGDDGFEDQDEPVDGDGGKGCEGLCVYSTDGFRDDLRENQDEEGEHEGD